MRIRPLAGNLSWAQQLSIQLVSRRADQLEWLRSFEFQQYLERWIHNSTVRHHLRGETAQADLSQGLISQWQDGLNAVVSMPAATAMYCAAEALRGAVMPALSPEDLPTQSGLILMPTTIYAQDRAGSRVGVSALSWSPCGIAPDRLGVLVCAWTHYGAEDDSTVQRRRWQALSTGAPAVESSNPHYLLLSVDPMVFDQDYELGPGPGVMPERRREVAEATTSLGHIDQDPGSLVMRLIYGAWDLLRQEVLTVGAVPLPPRAGRLYSQQHQEFPVVGVDVPRHLRSPVLTATRYRTTDAPTGRTRHAWTLKRPLMATAR